MTAKVKNAPNVPANLETGTFRRGFGEQHVEGLFIGFQRGTRKAVTAEGRELSWDTMWFADGQSFEVSSAWSRDSVQTGNEYSCRSRFGIRNDGTQGIIYEIEPGLNAFDESEEDHDDEGDLPF